MKNLFSCSAKNFISLRAETKCFYTHLAGENVGNASIFLKNMSPREKIPRIFMKMQAGFLFLSSVLRDKKGGDRGRLQALLRASLPYSGKI